MNIATSLPDELKEFYACFEAHNTVDTERAHTADAEVVSTVALTPIFSKSFEKLIKTHICSVLPASLDTLQFAYRSNRSTDDAIAFTLHTALSHLDSKNYLFLNMLFLDYSSAFNTIVPARLVMKLQTLGLNESLCSWIRDFLSGRRQNVRMGKMTSSSAGPQHWCSSVLRSQPTPVLPVHTWLYSNTAPTS